MKDEYFFHPSSFPTKLLSSSLRFARIRGVEIRFHFSMLFSIPIAYFLFRPTNVRENIAALLWLCGLILSIFLHEVGPAAAAQLVGVEVKSIVIWLLGGFTSFSNSSGKPKHNLAIFSAGPLLNMLLGFFFVVAYSLLFFWFLPFERDAELFMWEQTLANLSFSLALANMILVIFNLLPIYPLDGGNMLRSLMEIFFGRSNADWITLLISDPFLLGLLNFFITRAFLSSFPSQPRSWVTLSIGLILALFIALEEWSQQFFSTRTFDLLDLLASYAGVATFSFLAIYWRSQK